MKLNRLKSIVNQVVRGSVAAKQGYMLDPFSHFTPEIEYKIDLVKGVITPDCEGDDVEKYYKAIVKWFHEVLPKEGISMVFIKRATLTINPEGKFCAIEAQGRDFSAEYKFEEK